MEIYRTNQALRVERVAVVLNECDQLVAILTTIVKRVRQNAKRRLSFSIRNSQFPIRFMSNVLFSLFTIRNSPFMMTGRSR